MEFKHITSQTCPFCGMGVRSANMTGTHCNGQQNEEVLYWCGYHVQWVPNFSRMEVKSICPNTPEHKEKETKFAKKLKELEEFMRNQEYPEGFVEYIMLEIHRHAKFHINNL